MLSALSLSVYNLSGCAAPVVPTAVASGPVAAPAEAAAPATAVPSPAAAALRDLSGVVTFGDQPVAGYRVRVFDGVTGEPLPGFFETETDEQGRFRLQGDVGDRQAVRVVAAGAYSVLETTLVLTAEGASQSYGVLQAGGVRIDVVTTALSRVAEPIMRLTGLVGEQEAAPIRARLMQALAEQADVLKKRLEADPSRRVRLTQRMPNDPEGAEQKEAIDSFVRYSPAADAVLQAVVEAVRQVARGTGQGPQDQKVREALAKVELVGTVLRSQLDEKGALVLVNRLTGRQADATAADMSDVTAPPRSSGGGSSSGGATEEPAAPSRYFAFAIDEATGWLVPYANVSVDDTAPADFAASGLSAMHLDLEEEYQMYDLTLGLDAQRQVVALNEFVYDVDATGHKTWDVEPMPSGEPHPTFPAADRYAYTNTTGDTDSLFFDGADGKHLLGFLYHPTSSLYTDLDYLKPLMLLRGGTSQPADASAVVDDEVSLVIPAPLFTLLSGDARDFAADETSWGGTAVISAATVDGNWVLTLSMADAGGAPLGTRKYAFDAANRLVAASNFMRADDTETRVYVDPEVESIEGSSVAVWHFPDATGSATKTRIALDRSGLAGVQFSLEGETVSMGIFTAAP